MTARRSALVRAARNGGIPAYASDLRSVRGRCRAGTRRKPCTSRWGVVRVSLDYTSRERVDALATVECATCGHTWHRVTPPRIVSPDGYQATRLSVILPSEQRRWFARNRWHVTGEDAVTIREATLADLMAAREDWATRNGQYTAARDKARAKREQADREATARTVDLLARLAVMDAERAADDARD